METIKDYIEWMGDLDFDRLPLGEVDSIILCQLSYFDYREVFRGREDKAIPLKECLPFLQDNKMPFTVPMEIEDNRRIFTAACQSRRYGELLLTDNVDILDDEKSVQFAAVTFRNDKFAFIAYRGTDASIAGWKEDFMISFIRTDAQEMALSYAKKVIAKDDSVIYIGGHSKGGNSAMYAACMLTDEEWARVDRLYMLDGPGFCPEVIDNSLIERVDARMTRIIPEYSVVGMLFEPAASSTIIVQSSQIGILQHMIWSWGIDHGKVLALDKLDRRSQLINEVLDLWIENISQEERKEFIDELFDQVLTEGGSKNFVEVLGNFEKVLFSLVTKGKFAAKTLAKIPEKLFVQDELDKKRKEIKEKEETDPKRKDFAMKAAAFMQSPLFECISMILVGVGVFFASESVLEVGAIVLFGGLAALEAFFTIFKLWRNKWNFQSVKEPIMVTMILISTFLTVLVKEHALFVVGSMIFGVFFMALAALRANRATKKRTQTFPRVVLIIETVLLAVYGVLFLVIPQDKIIFSYASTIGIVFAADGLLRFIYWLVRKITKKA